MDYTNSSKKKVLGRGLSALLNEKNSHDPSLSNVIGNILEIPLEKITLNPYQPRTYFDEKTLTELIGSISSLGIIQPITVRKKDHNYELISGERRYQACKQLGISTIPAFIRLANDEELLEMALVENIQREELNPIEIALCYKRLIDETNLTQEELSLRLGKSRSSITNQIRILKLPALIQSGIQKKLISLGHGKALISLEKKEEQLDLYKKIIKNSLSVRQVENFVKNYKRKELPSSPTPSFSSIYLKETKDFFKKHFKYPIDVQQNKNGKGKVLIFFNSEKELEQIKKTFYEG